MCKYVDNPFIYELVTTNYSKNSIFWPWNSRSLQGEGQDWHSMLGDLFQEVDVPKYEQFPFITNQVISNFS